MRGKRLGMRSLTLEASCAPDSASPAARRTASLSLSRHACREGRSVSRRTPPLASPVLRSSSSFVTSRSSLFACTTSYRLPFHGVDHVAHLPSDRIVGLSKLARVVEFFARNLQLQERLTTDIAE